MSQPLISSFANLQTLREHLNKVTSFSQQGEDLIVQRIMERRLGLYPKSQQGFYVDIGAYHPISHSTTYLFYRFGWSGICVDISEPTCDIFRKVRPRDIVFHAAIASQDQKHAYRPAEKIKLTNEAQKPSLKAGNRGYQIDARSINSLLEETKQKERIDYLNIDVEGAELSAIKGLDLQRWAPRIITIEIHEKSLEAGLAHATARHLIERGYVCLACAAITYIFVRESDLA